MLSTTPAPAHGSRPFDHRPRRLVSPEKRDDDADASLRPLALADFTGQEAARDNLKVFIEAAKTRGEALDHVLFVGPPGLGKTTLAQIVARELGVNFRSTSGPVIAKAGDLAALLTNLEPRDVLFIDEIHRLNPAVEEILYPAMEDFQLDLIIGEGPAARSVKIDLAVHAGRRHDARRAADDAAARPLRHSGAAEFLHGRRNWSDRRARRARARRSASTTTARERDRPALARHAAHRRAPAAPRARFRPRRKRRTITAHIADKALARLDVDRTASMRSTGAISTMVAVNFGGGPVGIETIAAALAEPRDAIEDIIEPFLIQQGFVQRTPRGRMLTPHAFRHLGLAEPASPGCAVRIVRRRRRLTGDHAVSTK